jgi:hypothetical protein
MAMPLVPLGESAELERPAESRPSKQLLDQIKIKPIREDFSFNEGVDGNFYSRHGALTTRAWAFRGAWRDSLKASATISDCSLAIPCTCRQSLELAVLVCMMFEWRPRAAKSNGKTFHRREPWQDQDSPQNPGSGLDS